MNWLTKSTRVRLASHGWNGLRLLAVWLLAISGTGPALSGSLGDMNPVTSICPERYLQFWDTIVFTLAIDSLNNTSGRPSLQGGNEYDVKISRQADTVGDLRQLVADRLNQLDFTADEGSVTANHIGQLVQVDSAVTCVIPRKLRLPESAR